MDSTLEQLVELIMAETISCTLMEVCGTHTMAIAKSGIRGILPPNIRLLSGPGCPVCVTSQGDLDAVINLAEQTDITLVTFGDMLRVPGSQGSLQEARSREQISEWSIHHWRPWKLPAKDRKAGGFLRDRL